MEDTLDEQSLPREAVLLAHLLKALVLLVVLDLNGYVVWHGRETGVADTLWTGGTRATARECIS